MKILLLLFNCFYVLSTCGAGVIVPAGPLTYQDQKDIAFIQSQHFERPKRSGSGDFLNHLKHTIGQGIKSKITTLAKSSAAGLGAFSHSSSGHGHGHYPYYDHHPHPHPHHDDHHHHHHDFKPFDIWSFKKSVLYTLLQAVKAIKGGVIAIKGQLIKGGGHLLTAKGKLIRGGGEALTAIGKNIATSAFMVIPHDDHHHHDHHHHEDDHHHHHHHEEGHYDYGHYPSASAPSGPSGPQYAPTGYYAGGGQLNALYDGKHADGLVVLKKIPTGPSQHIENDVQETQHQTSNQEPTPDFRPLSDGLVPKIQNFMSSVFQASSSPSGSDEEPDPQASEQQHSNPIENNPAPLVQYLQLLRDNQNKIDPKEESTTTMYVTPPPTTLTKIPKPSMSQQPLILALPQNIDLAALLAQYQRSQQQQQQQEQRHQNNAFYNAKKIPDDAFLIHYPDYLDNNPEARNNDPKRMANKRDQTRHRHKYPIQLKTINVPVPTSRTNNNKQHLDTSDKKMNNLDIIRSIAFELGPNGPVKILQ